MINIGTKIHDKFSIEFKVGFSGSERDEADNFCVNTWIFVPYSLDINSSTYSKEQFYHDVKSNIRLITPAYPLSALCNESSDPFCHLLQSIQQLRTNNVPERQTECAFQIRMFAAIFKSSLREETKRLLRMAEPSAFQTACNAYIDNIHSILQLYRDCEKPADKECGQVIAYADEYMSHLTDMQVTKVLLHAEQDFGVSDDTLCKTLSEFLLTERNYKAAHGYSHLSIDEPKENQELVHRHSLLKKNIESALYLKVDTTADGAAAKQISFGMAAGIAMIISTLIALPFQKYLGNYPVLIFIILVIAYMFKDRIKELVRNQFAHRLKHKYFDHKTTINCKGKKIGWLKEGVDFISDNQVPDKVYQLRNRSGLETDNTLLGEKTILYRKQVHIQGEKLQHNTYTFAGIHDILRMHVQLFTQKMDDSRISLDSIDSKGKIQKINTLRIYPFHIVLQFEHNEQTEYRCFRIIATREGILSIEQINY